MTFNHVLSEAVVLTGTAQSTPILKVISTGTANATINAKFYGSATAIDVVLAPGIVLEAPMASAKVSGTGAAAVGFR